MAPSPPKAGATPRLDVLVVVHNQLEYVKRCIASLQKHTPNFRLLVWDNASDDETRRYLQKLARRKDVVLVRSEENLGFIVPNNRLAAQSSAPYLVLLNSDTEVHAGWDRALIAHLEAHPDVAEVGYGGGLLGPDAVGCGSGTGDAIDYVGGWCACIPRWVYETFGLFDEENLHFAYGEDSDFSLRLKEAGHKVHALSEPLVLHHGNKTILEVAGTRDTSATFRANHDYLRRRWAKYLREGRVLAPKTSELERLMNRGKELAAAQRAA
jgi:GT2 family glycosyltransferase